MLRCLPDKISERVSSSIAGLANVVRNACGVGSMPLLAVKHTRQVALVEHELLTVDGGSAHSLESEGFVVGAQTGDADAAVEPDQADPLVEERAPDQVKRRTSEAPTSESPVDRQRVDVASALQAGSPEQLVVVLQSKAADNLIPDLEDAELTPRKPLINPGQMMRGWCKPVLPVVDPTRSKSSGGRGEQADHEITVATVSDSDAKLRQGPPFVPLT